MTSLTVLDDTDESWPLLLGGISRLTDDRPFADYSFRTLHPESTEQDTYDEVVAAQGFDPLADREVRRAAA